MTTPSQVFSLIKQNIDEAVEQFGSYSFNDKGPHEVLDYDYILNTIRKLKPLEIKKVIEQISVYRDDLGVGETMASYLMDDLDYLIDNSKTNDLEPIKQSKNEQIVDITMHIYMIFPVKG